MALTLAQKQALKAAINGNPTWAAFPQNSDGYFALAQVLNVPADPAFTVWRTDAPVSTIIDSIDLSKYTPNDTIADADSGDLLQRKNGRLLTSQTKQMNLQLLVQGRERLNAAPPNVRGGLRDAVIQLPTGANGALTAPGGASGVNTLTVCTRLATEGEKILAVPSQASDSTPVGGGGVTARVLGFEGSLSAQDVEAARQLP